MNLGDEEKISTVLYTSGFVALFVGMVGWIVKEKHGGWLGFVKDLFASILLSLAVGLWCVEESMSDSALILYTGIAAFVAPDILAAVSKLTGDMRRNPIGIGARLFNVFKTGGRDSGEEVTHIPRGKDDDA